MAVSPSQTGKPKYWPSARYFTEAIQCPSICFAHPLLRQTLPAVDRLGMPLVTSGQFAYVYKLKSTERRRRRFRSPLFSWLSRRSRSAIPGHSGPSPESHQSRISLSSLTRRKEYSSAVRRFPILFMQWIEGPTLDLYIGEMLNRPDVLLHLSEEWLRLLSCVANVRNGPRRSATRQHHRRTRAIATRRSRWNFCDENGRMELRAKSVTSTTSTRAEMPTTSMRSWITSLLS